MNYPNNKIWEYCIFLGTFTDSLGRDLDLGVFEHKNDNSISYAVASSDDDGDYYSGGIHTFPFGSTVELHDYQYETLGRYIEYLRRGNR